MNAGRVLAAAVFTLGLATCEEDSARVEGCRACCRAAGVVMDTFDLSTGYCRCGAAPAVSR